MQTRASCTELAGLHGDAVKLRLAAPPVAGAANDALVRYQAALFDVPRTSLAVRSGHAGRRKLLAIDGLTVAAAERTLRLGGV